MFNTIQLSKSSQVPLYLQLANGLASFIETGYLPPKTKLPSIRSLAKQLKINRDTVVSAYKVLEQRGLTSSQTGRGTYVCPFPTLDKLDISSTETFSLKHKDLINFSSISLDTNFYHTKTLEEVCKYLKEYSIRASPSQVHIIQNLPRFISSLPKISDCPGVCVESPCKDISIFKEYGFKTFEVPITVDGLDINILENHLKTGKIQYIYITPYLQNPSGICYSEENKKDILNLAKFYNVYLIETDVYSDLLIDDIEYIPMHSQSLCDNVIYVKHFSSLYLPGLNYSFLVLPHNISTVSAIDDNNGFMYSIIYSILHNNAWQSNKKMIAEHYHNKYLLLCNLIDIYLSAYISYTCTFGGIYIWLTLETPHVSISDLCNELISNNILISPGTLFFTHKYDSPCFRLSIAGVSMTKIERGIKVIAKILFNSEFK